MCCADRKKSKGRGMGVGREGGREIAMDGMKKRVIKGLGLQCALSQDFSLVHLQHLSRGEESRGKMRGEQRTRHEKVA